MLATVFEIMLSADGLARWKLISAAKIADFDKSAFFAKVITAAIGCFSKLKYIARGKSIETPVFGGRPFRYPNYKTAPDAQWNSDIADLGGCNDRCSRENQKQYKNFLKRRQLTLCPMGLSLQIQILIDFSLSPPSVKGRLLTD